MSYKITSYTYDQAAKLGLRVLPSDKKKYKIKIYDGATGKFLFYGGDSNYSDYPTYILSHGKTFADMRRKLYHLRHKKEINKIGSRGYIISQLLW